MKPAQQQEVRLRGPASIEWRSDKRKLGRGNGKSKLDAQVKHVVAYDPRLEGTILVPIRDGIADVRRVREGRLQLFANPAIQNIRVGTMSVKSSEIVVLREGSYVIHYSVNRRARTTTAKVKADRSARVTLR